jgi:hypothetical protein
MTACSFIGNLARYLRASAANTLQRQLLKMKQQSRGLKEAARQTCISKPRVKTAA